MYLSKNKKYQYSFFILILIYSVFNGGNSNLLIQANFLLISFFYILCLRDKNYNHHFKYFVKELKRLNLSKINAAIIAGIVNSESKWASLKLPVALNIRNDEPEAKRVQII